MSLGEQLYLAMVVFVFVSFGGVMATLCWLDAIEDKALSRRKQSAPAKHGIAPNIKSAVYH